MARYMARTFTMAVLGLALAATSATAGTSDSSHGVRVHKLMTASQQPDKAEDVRAHAHTSVPRHRHRIVLRKGQRVLVRFGDGIGRSRYRKRYPGVQRPWQDRRFGRKHRRFLNPKGLYTSKIYRRGYH